MLKFNLVQNKSKNNIKLIKEMQKKRTFLN